ncbi:MAG TPA: HDIG domain-containing protein [Anaerolineae bacterium]|nr:HDIG domain-containing protein [Anaerolineae bacterium]HOQ97547.1 HDIG domain-containing protein [Anaerolineae bacterium]HPL28369.1 HDIG domain-containing protein [Anaerolineae bacterium]
MNIARLSQVRARERISAHLPSSARWRTRIGVILLALFLTVSVSGVLLVRLLPDNTDLRVGEPAPRTILAPQSVSYVSHYLTEEQRNKAAAQVAPVYAPIDAQVVRKQLALARDITDYLDAVRSDVYATPEGRQQAVAAIDTLKLSPAAINAILSLDNASWNAVRADVITVLEQAMRSEIRKDELADARRRVPALVGSSLSASGREAAEALVQALLVPNSFYDEATTEQLRLQAREKVLPVSLDIKQGEAVVREGELVTPLQMEELETLGLHQEAGGWGQTAGTVLFVALLTAVLVAYIHLLQPELWQRPRRVLLLALSLIAAAAAARLMVPEHTLLPYLFPAAALAMLASVLIEVRLGIFFGVLLSLLVGFVSGGSLELVAYTLMGSLVGSLALSQMQQLNSFAQAGALVALANILTVAAFRLFRQDFDTAGLLQLLVATMGSGALSASLTLAAYAFVGRVFGITTSLQLLELARPTHPLFRQLLLKAPGTYHHSIIVANMAERAAEAVGADPLLARVGAYYHDIGKAQRPYFFIENQAEGSNPHDRLDPKTSAQIIISHTSDGVALARQHGLPERVQDIIAQHHGTTKATFFYRMACKEAKEGAGVTVNESDFSYPGPLPDTKEAAIVMLADVEAVVRSVHPETPAAMEDLIRQFVEEKLIGGQLDHCNLTLRDLDNIREAFGGVLKSIFHPRIQYPEEEK